MPAGGVGYARRNAKWNAAQSTANTPTGTARSFRAMVVKRTGKEEQDRGWAKRARVADLDVVMGRGERQSKARDTKMCMSRT